MLELTAANAEVGAPSATGAPAENDWTLLLSAMAGQCRRRSGPRNPARRDSSPMRPAWSSPRQRVDRQRDGGGRPALAVDQSGGARARGRSGAGRRDPLDRSPRRPQSVRPIPLGCARRRQAGARRQAEARRDRRAAGHPEGDLARRCDAPRTADIVADFRLAETSLGRPGVQHRRHARRPLVDRSTVRMTTAEPGRARCHDRGGVRGDEVGGEGDEDRNAAGGHASSRRAAEAVSCRGARRRGREAARRQPEPVSDVDRRTSTSRF